MKTWEMLRDIREGDTYELTSSLFDGCSVSFREREGYARKVLVWTKANGEYDGEFVVSVSVLGHTWRKRQQLVDFPTAFAAYEAGNTIRPESVSGATGTYTKGSRGLTFFCDEHIRGKWTIEEAHHDAN